MRIEERFAKVLGRPPNTEEQKRLEQLQEACELHDNDGFVAVLIVLELYAGLHRQYPERCAQAAKLAVKDAFEGLERVRSRTVPAAPAPPPPAAAAQSPLLASSRELYWVTLAGFGTAYSVLVGSLGMAVGGALSSGSHPCWVRSGVWGSVAANVLGAPAGWLVLVALLVPSGYAALWGWRRGQDSSKSRQQRGAGWTAVGAILVGLAVWLRVVLHI